jgi:hypothetical protein
MGLGVLTFRSHVVAFVLGIAVAAVVSWVAPGFAVSDAAPNASATAGGVEPAHSAADSSTTNPGGEALRGTEQELPRRASTLRKAGRIVLFVPYIGVEVIAWPIEQIIGLGERSGIAQGIVDFVTFQLAYRKLELGLYLKIQTGAGSPAPGIRATLDDWARPGSEFELVAGYWSRDRNQLDLEASTAPADLRFSLAAQINNREDQPFYGIGPHTANEKYASNRQRKILEGTLLYRPRRRLPLTATAYFRDTDLSRSSNQKSVQDGFPDAYETAANGRYAGVEASVAFDGRDRDLLATSGAMLRVLGGYNFSQIEDEDYAHYAVSFETYVNLYRHTRVLVLRAYGAGIDTKDPSSLPYTELERPGGETGMRGYSRYRFADRTQLVLNGSYRFRVTNNVMSALFVDWGSVARSWDKMRLADIGPSVGAGIAFLGRRPIGFQMAYSHEGWQFYFGFESIFKSESRRLR